MVTKKKKLLMWLRVAFSLDPGKRSPTVFDLRIQTIFACSLTQIHYAGGLLVRIQVLSC